MKFYLKNNRSEQFSYFTDNGYCVGRENEIHSLQHVLKNLNSSSILISGVRGTGKTSFVHKAIKGLGDNFVPIFINLKEKPTDKGIKSHLLTSIIRATYLSDRVNKNDLENLYYNSLGKFEEFQEYENNEEKEQQEKEKRTKTLKISGTLKDISLILGCCLAMSGILIPENIRSKFILLVLGLIIVGLGYTNIFETIEKKVNKSKIRKGLKWKIENSQEFLEIEFEKWLKNQNKKIIFVIDEMDKVGKNEEVIQILKEQKNLFTRSCAHFLFITDETSYELVNSGNRKDEEIGIFPTIFSHIYYLPTPQFEDLQEYLDNIIETKITDENKKYFEDLKSYLLFKSLNDYFLLKNFIHDNLEYEGDKIFLSSDTIKNHDKSFKDIVNVYNYINKSLEKFIYTTKGEWKNNSDLINYVYDFLNKNLGKNFNKNDIKYDYFLEILNRGGLITNIDDNYCAWTGKYDNLKSAHELYEYEKDFLTNFKEMVRIANDLDDYPDIFTGKKQKFQIYDGIKSGRDGANISNISLYTLYEKYQKLYKNLNNKISVYKIKKEETENANKEVKLSIDNVKNSILTIITNTTSQIIARPLTISNAIVTTQNSQIMVKLNQLPHFKAEVQKLQHSIFGIGEKIVLIVNRKEGEQYELLKEHNEVFLLKGSNNFLVIDMEKASNNTSIKNKQYSFVDETDKRKREKGTIDNYYTVKYNDIRDLIGIFPKIKSFLEN